jgi:hypothetical protein
MNRIPKLLALLSLTFACALPAAFGQIVLETHGLYAFDESGQGSFRITGTGALPFFISNIHGTVALDPFLGVPSLSYPVSSNASPGDVRIYDDAAQSVLSDVIRFDGHGHLFFYSQLQPGETPELADVPQLPPLAPQLPFVSITETNFLHGGMGVDYLIPATSALPGADGTTVEFLFITEVPEPAPAFLLPICAGLLLIGRLAKGASPRTHSSKPIA